MNSLPDNGYALAAVIVVVLGQVATAGLGAFAVWQNSQLNKSQSHLSHQLNSLTDQRVASAGAAGHAEGMIVGAAGERAETAKILASEIAAEVARKWAEEGKPAIAVKAVDNKS